MRGASSRFINQLKEGDTNPVFRGRERKNLIAELSKDDRFGTPFTERGEVMDLHNARKTYGMLKGCIRNDAGFNLPRVTTIKWSLMGGLPNYFPEEYTNQMFEVETPFLLGGTEREVIIRTLDGNIFLISESDIEILLTLEDVAVELAYIVTPPPKPKKKEYIATTPPRPLAKKARRKKATPKMESKSKGKGSPFPFDM